MKKAMKLKALTEANDQYEQWRLKANASDLERSLKKYGSNIRMVMRWLAWEKQELEEAALKRKRKIERKLRKGIIYKPEKKYPRHVRRSERRLVARLFP